MLELCLGSSVPCPQCLLCADCDVAPASLLALGLTPAEEESPRKDLKSLPVLQASKKLVAATGQQCLPLSVDVRQPQTIAAAVDEALREFKRIDILVNGELLQWPGGDLVQAPCQEGHFLLLELVLTVSLLLVLQVLQETSCAQPAPCPSMPSRQ